MITRFAYALACLFLAGLMASCASKGEVFVPETISIPAPPTAQRSETVDVYHGVEVPDPYRWLEDPHSAETRAWVDLQNERSRAYFEALAPLVDGFHERLLAVWNYPRRGTTFRDGGAYWSYRNTGLQDQSPLYRQKTLDSPAELILDPNTFSENGTVALAGTGFSRDGRYLAYMTSARGSDWREARVLDLETLEHLDVRLEWLKFTGIEWAPGGEGFFYGRYPQPRGDGSGTYIEENSDYRIYFHRLGTDQSEDVVVFETPDDPDLTFGVSVSEDGEAAGVSVWRGTDLRNGYFMASLVDGIPGPGDFREIQPLGEAEFWPIAKAGRTLYVITNAEAPRRRVVTIDMDEPEKPRLEIIAQSGETLEDVWMIQDELIVHSLHDAFSVLRRYDLEGELLGEIPLPGPGSAYGSVARRDDTEFFFKFTSFLHPGTIYRYDVVHARLEKLWEPDVPGFDPDLYETRQIFATSADGTRVPAFVTHRRGLDLDGGNPALLHGYGGFMVSMRPYFRTNIIPWIESGGVYVHAILRGGGEYGRDWYEAGTKERKQNVFDDFAALANWLAENGYARPERLGIEGGSNGGLLVGASITQRPGLFGAALCHVGLLDMLRYQHFTIGKAWTGEYGSSGDPDLFPVLRAYSPVHNVEEGVEYPAVLLTTAAHDDRVVPAHTYKFAAALQAGNGGSRPILARVETDAGHGQGKPLSMLLRETAEEWAFLAHELGLEMEP